MFSMIDMIGAVGATTVLAAIVGVIAASSGMRRRARLGLIAAAAAWLVFVVTVSALGGFEAGVAGAVPTPVATFFVLLVLLFGGWRLFPELREGLLAVPFSALVGLHVARLGGLAFLLLSARDRLSEPFATVAGGGDMVIAALAIPLALVAARRPDESPRWLGTWNVLGALDLAAAIGIGALSAPGTPFQVFTEEPGTAVFSALPWVLVPTTLVPLFLLLHFVIAVRLRERQPSAQNLAAAPSGSEAPARSS